MSFCVSGLLTPEEEKWLSLQCGTRCVIPRPGSTLYVGSACADGRPIEASWKYHEAQRLGLPIRWIRAEMGQRDKKDKRDKEEKKTENGLGWADKYRPTTLSEVIGHKSEIQSLRNWLSAWSSEEKGEGRGVEKRAVLITGPPGIGKTTVVHLLAKEFGYAIKEYNASDTRSVSALRGAFALGMRRLRREVIVMDEVDGLSERGGVVELAGIIQKTTSPIFCIANEKGTKLKPLVAVCAELRFSRPLRSTIAIGLERIVQAEGMVGMTRNELEGLCERNGNDIRAVLHQLEFQVRAEGIGAGADKDACHRMEPFSVTQRLFAGKRMSWSEATDLVFVDSHLIPLMVQEAYVHAGRSDMEAIAEAAEAVGRGDILTRRVYQTQDWGLIPHAVASSIEVVRRVPGTAPFQLFPQVLGKTSKQRKQVRWMEDMGRRVGLKGSTFRMDVSETLRTRMVTDLVAEGAPFRHTISVMDTMGLTRDDVFEALEEVSLVPVAQRMAIPTALRSAFTREWNKTHDAEEGGFRRVVSKGKKGVKGTKGAKEAKKAKGVKGGKEEEQEEKEVDESEEEEDTWEKEEDY
jgi:replication factor C subunit 1